MKIAVVIAAYNESGNIAPLTERLINTLDALPGASWKLIYVIDGTDGTVDIARKFAERRPEIEILYNEKPSGLGQAFRRGFAAVPADTDFVVTMDADLNHQPEEIPALLAALQARNADIVVGSRRLGGSSVTGTPLWKRSVSRAGNRLMHIFMSMRIQDLTSGFRIYRIGALKQLEFENVGFAFLPEILIQAASRRLMIIEEPIQFVFRTSGESKMQITSTGWSYLRLFLTHSRGIAILLAVLLILVGIGLHIAFCFPLHRSVADSDAVLAGLCALNVNDGHLPLFFPGGYRLSSQSCYLTAAFFQVFGPNRAALGATSVTYGSLFLVFGWLALRQAAGAWAALPGLLLLVLPPVQFWLVTYPAWGYAEIMTFCACTLWLGFRLLRPEISEHPIAIMLFGISVGFSFWTSPQSLMVTLPVIGLLLWRKALRYRQWLVIAASAAVIAAIPYAIVVARHGLAPFAHSYATQPASGAAQLVANVEYLFTYTWPLLLFSETSNQISLLSLNTLRIITVSLGFVTILVVALRGDDRGTRSSDSRVPLLFPVLVLLFGFALYVGSGAGGVRGWTVRYAAPLYLMIPLGAALLLSKLRTDSAKAFTLLVIVILATLQAVDYPIFNRQVREQQILSLADSEAAIAWLKRNHIDVAIGSYWNVYYLNFDGLRSVIALPLAGMEDYFEYGRELDSRQLHAALLDNNQAHLEDWARRLQQRGRIQRINNELSAFVVDDPVDSSILDRARATAR